MPMSVCVRLTMILTNCIEHSYLLLWDFLQLYSQWSEFPYFRQSLNLLAKNIPRSRLITSLRAKWLNSVKIAQGYDVFMSSQLENLFYLS